MSAQSTRGRPPAADCNLLWALSGNVCAAPDCQAQLVDHSSGRGVTQGEIAHIHASSESGPRFDPALSGTERDAYENTLLLCRYHHRQVDAAPEQFSADELRGWKYNHEQQSRTVLLSNVREQGLLQSPPLPTDFVRRQAITDQLLQRLSKGVALTGLSGSGKTLLAVDAMEQAGQYSYRFWLRGGTQQTLEADLQSLGVYLQLSSIESPTPQAARQVMALLETRQDCLVVIDGLAEDALLAFPSMGISGNVLITTQAAALPGVFTLAVPMLSDVEADKLLSRSPRLRQAPPDIRHQIAGLCAHLPLAIAQVTAYSAATGMSAGEHLALLRERRGELLSRGGEQHATLVSSMHLVWERLSTTARELAGALAQLADSALPISREGFQAENPVLPLSDPLAFEDAIALLRRYSLIERADGLVKMHSLVREVISESLAGSGARRQLVGGLVFVSSLVPYWTGRPDAWAVMERLEPHITWLIGRVEGLTPALAAALSNKLGPYLESRGRLAEARTVLETSLARLSENHDMGLRGSLSQNLANVYADMGRFDDALPLMKEAAALKERAYGPNDSLTAVGFAGVANLLHSLGRTDQAIGWYKQALTIYEGKGDLESIAETKLDLARVYIGTDRATASRLIDEAKTEVSRCVDVWHLEHTLHVTASLLHEAEGQLPAAAKEAGVSVRLARSAAPLSKELAQSLALHGRLLLHIGVPDSGMRLLEKACQIDEQLGFSHSVNAARARGNLGLWLVQLNIDFQRGERLLRESLETLTELLPNDSHSVLLARLMWAEALPFLGQFDTAREAARFVERTAVSDDLRSGARYLIERLEEFTTELRG